MCQVTAALSFVYYKQSVLLANIAGRGWTIPGGRLEQSETAEAAIIREVFEEVGARIERPQQIGCYLLKRALASSERVTLTPLYIAQTLELNSLPSGSESLGTRLVSPHQLEEVYYIWDELIDAVCSHAHEQARKNDWL